MLGPDDHYIIISADTHAGGSHAQYREFLEEKYVADFDAWREKYNNLPRYCLCSCRSA